MRFSNSGFRGKNSWLAAAVVAALFLAGCSEDPGLQEKLTRLQAEMQEKDRQLQEVQSALEKTKSELKSARAAATTASSSKPTVADAPAATPAPTPQTLSKEQLEESYAASTKAMQRRVASELKNYSVENYTQFPVTMPSDEYPYHSKIGLAIRSDSGRSYRLEFPVSADVSGKWTFPTSVDVASALADTRQQEPNTATASNPATPAPTATPRVAQNNTPAPTPRTTTQSDPQIVPGQASSETRTIDWGGGRSTNPNKRPAATPTPANASNNGNNVIDPFRQQPTPARQQPTPAREVQQPMPRPSNSPTQAMQSDKDVTIHW